MSRLSRALVLLVALALAMSACASAQNGASSTPSASPPPSLAATPTAGSLAATPTAQAATPAPTPSINLGPPNGALKRLATAPPIGFKPRTTCSGSIGASDPVAVVQLGAASGLPPTVMRDYADPAHPRTVCTFRDGFVLQLIDPKHIVVQGSCPSANVCYAVVDLPEVRFHWFALPTGTYDEFYAMSPNGAQIAWTSTNQSGSDRHVHLTDASGDHILAALRDEAGRCGSPTDSRRGAYTRSGSFLFVLDQPQVRDNVLVVASGTKRVFLLAPPATAAGWAMTQYPYMALWSPTSPTLFYARGTDVWRWTPTAGPKIFLPGVEWFSPTITPNGRYLAYSILQADGIHHDVYLVDLVNGGSPRLIGHNRTVPAFVNNTQLWWMTEDEQFCGAGGLKPAIYNMTDHTQGPSIIDSVIDTWPGTHS